MGPCTYCQDTGIVGDEFSCSTSGLYCDCDIGVNLLLVERPTNKEWQVIGSGDSLNHVFVVGGVRKAALWFLGGHVERDDSWNVTYPPDSHMARNGRGFDRLEEAKQHIEKRYEEEPW